MKSYIACKFSSKKLNPHRTRGALMRHCLIWQWLHEVVAPGYSLYFVMGPSCKKHNDKVGPWRLAWWWKKVPKSSLWKALKAPHLHRRRNQFFTRNNKCDKKKHKTTLEQGRCNVHNRTWNCSSKAGSRRQNQEKNDVNTLCKRKGGGKSSPHAGAKMVKTLPPEHHCNFNAATPLRLSYHAGSCSSEELSRIFTQPPQCDLQKLSCKNTRQQPLLPQNWMDLDAKARKKNDIFFTTNSERKSSPPK
jgi:hypothetical protein